MSKANKNDKDESSQILTDTNNKSKNVGDGIILIDKTKGISLFNIVNSMVQWFNREKLKKLKSNMLQKSQCKTHRSENNSTFPTRMKSTEEEIYNKRSTRKSELNDLHKCKLIATNLNSDDKLDLICHLLIGSKIPAFKLDLINQIIGGKSPNVGKPVESIKTNTNSETKTSPLLKGPSWKFRRCSINPFLPYVDDMKIHSDRHFRAFCFENSSFRSNYDSIFDCAQAIKMLNIASDKEVMKKILKTRTIKIHSTVKTLREKYLKSRTSGYHSN